MSPVEAQLESRLVVTGGGGFIGRRLVKLARARNLTVAAPRRSELDWTNLPAVRAFMAETHPRVVIHLASLGVFAPDPDDPVLIDHECTMMHNLLSTIAPDCRLVSGGSMAEYGQSGRLSEDMDCTPHNAYARAKFAAGQMLLDRLNSGGVEGCHTRLFGVFGAGEAPKRLFPTVLTKLRYGEEVLLSDGMQLRDFVHVDDVCRALLSLASLPLLPHPVINIGTGQAVGLRTAIERVAAELEAPIELLRFGAIPRSVHDQDVLEADTDRLDAAIGWVPPQRILTAAPLLALL